MQIRFSSLAAVGAVLLIATQAFAQTATFDFETPGNYIGNYGPDQGWGSGFDGQPGAGRTLPTVLDPNPGDGTLYAHVTRTGGFQETAYQTGDTNDPFFIAMAAAAGNSANAFLDYDWYVDTSTIQAGGAGTFFQLGSYVNTGNGYYAQDFGSPKEVELNGTQLASGQVFAGHVHLSFATMGYAIPAAQTFFRLGFIENGNGAAQYADFDNITVSVVPEPSTMILGGLGALGLLAIRRRK
jgi:PEP-CTERM motif